MSRLLLSITLLVFINSLYISKTAARPPSIDLKTVATSSTKYQNYKTYVETSCKSTTYPTICNNTLSPYSSTIKSNPIKLCTTSLGLNAKYAYNATALVSSLYKKAKSSTSKRDVSILKDCLEEMKDTVDELKQAYAEMKKLSRGGDQYSIEECLKNVRTWVSAAVTDEGTCTDELDEGNVSVETKKKVKKAVSDLSKITSNTLALVTKYPSYY